MELDRDFLPAQITISGTEDFYNMEGVYGEVGSETVFAKGGVIKSSVTGINAQRRGRGILTVSGQQGVADEPNK